MIRKAMRWKDIGIEQISQAIGVPVLTAVSKLYGDQLFSPDEAILLQRCLFPEYTLAELFSERGDAETQQLAAQLWHDDAEHAKGPKEPDSDDRQA